MVHEPLPDPRAESEGMLVEVIRDEIAAAPGARITFARFMERALTEPGMGYYATSDARPTRAGDFLTAPELHPFFGRCLGRQLTQLWERLGSPMTFVVREWGAGRGELARSVIKGLEADASGLADAVEWQPVDLPARQPRASGSIAGVILANEYLDALPVHAVAWRKGRLRERYVTWRDGRFEWLEDEPSTPEVEAHLDADGVALSEGQLAEICLAAPRWVAEAAGQLERGALLIIDYGHPAPELYGPRRRAGSLVTYREHVVGVDPFRAVGRGDITAHVDLTALELAAAACGLAGLGSTTQARFLAGLGLGDLLSDLGRDPSTGAEAYLDARTSVLRLLDPRHLGGFRVLAFGRGLPPGPELRGFAVQLGRP